MTYDDKRNKHGPSGPQQASPTYRKPVRQPHETINHLWDLFNVTVLVIRLT